jgi:hypothetical protein
MKRIAPYEASATLSNAPYRAMKTVSPCWPRRARSSPGQGDRLAGYAKSCPGPSSVWTARSSPNPAGPAETATMMATISLLPMYRRFPRPNHPLHLQRRSHLIVACPSAGLSANCHSESAPAPAPAPRPDAVAGLQPTIAPGNRRKACTTAYTPSFSLTARARLRESAANRQKSCRTRNGQRRREPRTPARFRCSARAPRPHR